MNEQLARRYSPYENCLLTTKVFKHGVQIQFSSIKAASQRSTSKRSKTSEFAKKSASRSFYIISGTLIIKLPASFVYCGNGVSFLLRTGKNSDVVAV